MSGTYSRIVPFFGTFQTTGEVSRNFTKRRRRHCIDADIQYIIVMDRRSGKAEAGASFTPAWEIGMAFACYREVEAKRLRLGFTTGTAAALAAAAATRFLLGGVRAATESLTTPSGIVVEAEISELQLTPEGGASCQVTKDAGDDPDVTNGLSIVARVWKRDQPGVGVDGGAGVGRVTKAGLDQPVGAAAINSRPRAQIAAAVNRVAGSFAYQGGLAVLLEIPGGEEVAKRTFNPQLGIVGGLSILGTSGIVEPMSTRAVVETMALEMKMHRAGGHGDLLLVPGNYGLGFAQGLTGIAAGFSELAGWPKIVSANFFGEAIDLAKREGFRRVLLLGHLGKLIKISGGIMDAHSRVADARLELLALHAALSGADRALLEEVLVEPTVDAGMALIRAAGLGEAVAESILRRIDRYLSRRWGGVAAPPEAAEAEAGGGIYSPVGAVVFVGRGELLGISPAGKRLLLEGKR